MNPIAREVGVSDARRIVRMTVVLVASSTLAGSNLRAQGTPSTPRPSVPHERLAVFEGTWTRSDVPPGRSFRETCEWLAGNRRHMICRQRSESPDGVREQMVIYSYQRSDSTYAVTVLLAGGQVWRYAGRPEGDRWVLTLVSNAPDSPRRLRQVITAGKDTLHFKEEASENGGPWRLTDPSEDYRYVRVRSAPPASR